MYVGQAIQMRTRTNDAMEKKRQEQDENEKSLLCKIVRCSGLFSEDSPFPPI